MVVFKGGKCCLSLWPSYFLLQLGHINRYTALESYLSPLCVHHFPVCMLCSRELLVLKAIFNLVCLKSLIISTASLLTYVKVNHFCLVPLPQLP